MTMLKEFKQFLLRGNVVDLAVGVAIGASFGAVVSALVADFITPLIAVIVKVPELSELSFTVRGSKFMYGHLLNAVISFVLAAAAIFFFIIKPMNILISKSKSRNTPPSDPTTKKCKECLSEIPVDAKRCAHCTQPV